MVRIPTTDPQVRLSIGDQPNMPLSFGTAPGRALQGLGNALESLGGSLRASANAAQKDQDDDDMFQTRMVLGDFGGEQDRFQIEYDGGIADMGKGHAAGRLQTFDEASSKLYERIPNNPKAQRYAALKVNEMRERYGTASSRVEAEQRGRYYTEQSTNFLTSRILPGITEDVNSAMSGLKMLDAFVEQAKGLPPGVAERLREAGVKAVTDAWIAKAGPEAYDRAATLAAAYGPGAREGATPGSFRAAQEIERSTVPATTTPSPSRLFYDRTPTQAERAQIFRNGGVVVNLDTNWAPTGSQTSPMVVIPDDATPQQRQAAEAYAAKIAEVYQSQFGASLPPRVVTRSQNGRGRAFTIHTEPFSVKDERAVAFFTGDEGRKLHAQILRDTFGQIPGVHFSLPHDPYRKGDMGARGGKGSEVDFARLVMQELRGAEPLPTGQRADPTRLIVDAEARRDAQGRIQVYQLPPGDGGGRFEVAGINDRYHPQAARKLAGMVRAGKHDEAEAYAARYIKDYTEQSAKAVAGDGPQYLIRDIAFNRGPGGANAAMRMALGATPNSKAAADKALTVAEREQIYEMSKRDPAGFIAAVTRAREQYEYTFVGRRERFDRGLRNRWAKAQDNALNFVRRHGFEGESTTGEAGATDPARVADASGTMAPQPRRALVDRFAQALIERLPQIKKTADEAERRQIAAERTAEREQRAAIRKDGIDRLYSGTLTEQWVEDNRDTLSPGEYQSFKRAVRPIVRVTDPAVRADLLARADEMPEEIEREAFQAYAQGDLAKRDLDRIIQKARGSYGPEAAPRHVKEQRAIIKSQLRPPKNASAEQIEAYGKALAEFDDYVTEAGGNLEPKALREWSIGLVERTRTGRIQERRLQLDVPRFVPGGRDAMSLSEVYTARLRLSQAFAAGEIKDKADIKAQLDLLKSWEDLFLEEYKITGKEPPSRADLLKRAKAALEAPAAPTQAVPAEPATAAPPDRTGQFAVPGLGQPAADVKGMIKTLPDEIKTQVLGPDGEPKPEALQFIASGIQLGLEPSMMSQILAQNYGQGFAPFGTASGQGQFTGTVDGTAATTADFNRLYEAAQNPDTFQQMLQSVDQWAERMIADYDQYAADGRASPEAMAAMIKAAEDSGIPLAGSLMRMVQAASPQGQSTPLNPVIMTLEGIRSAARWLSLNPDRIRPEDMIAPAGASFMAAPFMRSVMREALTPDMKMARSLERVGDTPAISPSPAIRMAENADVMMTPEGMSVPPEFIDSPPAGNANTPLMASNADASTAGNAAKSAASRAAQDIARERDIAMSEMKTARETAERSNADADWERYDKALARMRNARNKLNDLDQNERKANFTEMPSDVDPNKIEQWAADLADEYFGDWGMASRELTPLLQSSLNQLPDGAAKDETIAQLVRLKGAKPLTKSREPTRNVSMEKTPLVVYHGSDQMFDRYDMGKAKEFEGVGAYRGPEDVMFASESPDVANHFGSNVYRLQTKARLFDPEDGADVELIRPWIEKQPNPGQIAKWLRPGTSGAGQMNYWIGIEETPGMIAELKRLGFDGARMSEWHGSKGNMPTIALWNRGNVKHAETSQTFFSDNTKSDGNALKSAAERSPDIEKQVGKAIKSASSRAAQDIAGGANRATWEEAGFRFEHSNRKQALMERGQKTGETTTGVIKFGPPDEMEGELWYNITRNANGETVVWIDDIAAPGEANSVGPSVVRSMFRHLKDAYGATKVGGIRVSGARGEAEVMETILRSEIEGGSKAGNAIKSGAERASLDDILKKIDPGAAKATQQDTLTLSSGEQGGQGFTIFPITDKVREEVRRGMPLFAKQDGTAGDAAKSADDRKNKKPN